MYQNVSPTRPHNPNCSPDPPTRKVLQMTMIAYPSSWKDAADVMIDELPGVLTGNYANMPKVVRALWNAQGYLTGKFYPDKPDVTGLASLKRSLKAAGAKELTAEEFIKRLKMARGLECPCDDDEAEQKGSTKAGLTAVDWKSLLLTILQILIQLLG